MSAKRDVFSLADSRYKKVARYRNVHFDHELGAVVVYDKVRTRNGRKASFSQNWHLPPGWTLDRVGRGYARFVKGQERIWFRIVPLSFQEGKKTRRGQLFGMGGTTVSQTLRAPDTDTRLSGPTVRFRDRAESTAFLTVIVASSQTTRTSAELVPGSRPGTVTVQVGGKTKSFDVG